MRNADTRPFRSALRALGSAAVIVLVALPAQAQTVTPPAARATPSAPLARISAPAKDQTVRGTIDIQGSATAPNFARYEVSFQAEARPTSSWTLISGDVQEVREGTLAVWTTRPLSDTAYAVRVQVFTRDNAVLEAIVRNVVVSNTLPSGAVAAGPIEAAQSAVGPVAPAKAPATAINLADFPRGFGLGVRYTGYAFVAFCAYLLVKRLAGWLWKRLGPPPPQRYGD